MADANAACERVQNDAKLPVSCTTQYIDDVPSMIVGFRDDDGAREWMGSFAKHIGGPFCDAANRNGRQARVYMTVGAGAAQRARMWSCELGKWSDWFATAPEAPASPAAETIADAIRLCNEVQANRSVPVTCRTEYIDGMPAMIVGFPTPDDAETYMNEVAEKVAAPFCNAANRANRHASLFVTLADVRARHFDCEQQRWGDWFELSRAKAPNRDAI